MSRARPPQGPQDAARRVQRGIVRKGAGAGAGKPGERQVARGVTLLKEC